MNDRDDFFAASMMASSDKDNPFDSKSIVDAESGKVLGGLFKVPVGLATAVEAAWNRFEPEARKVIKNNLNKTVEVVAQRYGHMDPVESKALGYKVSDAFGYASVFWQDFIYSGSSTLKANQSLIALRNAVSPVLKANHQHMGVGILMAPGVDNEVISNARGKIVDHWMHQLGQVVFDLPARIPNLYITHQESLMQNQERALELEAEKMKNAGVDERRDLIRKQMEEFRETKRVTDKDLEKMLKDERRRFDSEMRRRGFKEQGGKGSGNYVKDGQYENWSSHKNAFTQKYKEVFAKHDTKDLSAEKTLTEKKKAEIEEKIRIAKEYGTWGGALLSQAASYQLDRDAEKKFNKPLALDMILHFKSEVDTNPDLKKAWLVDHDSAELPGEPGGKHEGQSVSVKEYIIEIFQQNQSDSGRPKIGERFLEKDADMDRIATQIADAIMHEKMDPLALVDLVGQRKVVKRSGKHFASEKQLEQLIEHEAHILPAKQHVDMEEFQSNTAFEIDDLKEIFDKEKGVKGQERVFLALTFPKDVLIKHAGLAAEEVEGLYKEAEGRFHQMMENAVKELAYAAEHNPEELKKLKITDREIKALMETAQAINDGDEHALDRALGIGGEAGVEQTVRNVAVQMTRHDKGFIHRLLESRKSAEQDRMQQEDNSPSGDKADAKGRDSEIDREKLEDLIGNESSREYARGDDEKAVVPSRLAEKVASRGKQSPDPSLGLSV